MKSTVVIKTKGAPFTADQLRGIMSSTRHLRDKMDFMLLDPGLELEVLPQVSPLTFLAGQAMAGLLAQGNPEMDVINESIKLAENMMECLEEREREKSC